MTDPTPAQARALLAKLRETDPIYHYTPLPTCALFHASDAYFRLLESGGQAGKSTAACAEMAMLLRGIHPHKRFYGPITGLYMCVSRQQAAMVVQEKLFGHCGFPDLPGAPPGIGNYPFIPKHEVKDYGSIKAGVRATYFIELTNGSKLYFAWSGSDHVYEIIQGPSLDVVALDENVGERKLMIELRKRLLARQNKKNWSGQLWWAAHGTSMNEEYDDFRIRCMDPNDEDHAYFPIGRTENPAVTQEGIDRFAKTLTVEEQAIHVYGTKTAGELTRIFGEQFDDKLHMLPTDYVPSPQDNLWLGYDPGVDHPTGMALTAISPDKPIQHKVIKCWLHRNKISEFDLQLLEQYLCGRRLAGIVYDTAASNASKSGISVIGLIMDMMLKRGMSPLAGFFKSNKGHYKNIMLARHYLRPNVYEPTTEPLIVINPSQESGGPLLRWQFLKYSGKEGTKFTGPGGVVKKDDDLLDAMLYLVAHRVAYNKDWACGHASHSLVDANLPPVPIPYQQLGPELSPHERRLADSRARTGPRHRRGTPPGELLDF